MPSYDPVGVFWDYENCPPSTNASGYSIVDNIRTIANQFGAVNTFKAYLQLPDKSSPRQSSLRSELQSCGLSLTDCPHNGKNSVDLMMIVDIMAFIKDTPPPATVILISGDRDFAYLLSTVRWRKYGVVLISNSFMTHESLTVQASAVYDWKSDILKTRPSSKPPLLGSHTLSSVASLTTPQESDNLPESDVHAAGHPYERVTPVIQSSTLSPRPVGTTTIGTVGTICTAPPPDAQLMELEGEATLMTPRAGTPTEAASASSPMNAAPDDCIAADSVGGQTTGSASPKTTDLDEDDFYSPAFSSLEMTPSQGEGDAPSSPGRLLLIDEARPVEPSIHDLRDTDLSGAIKPVSRACEACECNIYPKSPVLLASNREIVGGHPAEPTPCEPLSLPTAAPSVPPPELSPAHDIPPSEAGVKSSFEDLIVVLSQLSANGNPTPRFSTAFSLLRERRPDTFGTVGAAKFKAYIQLAESAGVVAVEQHQSGDGLVTLRRQWNPNSDSPSHHTLPQHAGSRFHDLIKILDDLRLAGDPEPRISIVCPQLLRNNPSIYEDADMTRFEYIEAAVEAGVVTVCGLKNGDGSLKLCPAYRSPHVCSSTPVRAAGNPPLLYSTPAPSTAPPFIPLVGFLKSKQLTSAQPISLSEVFAHLVSTLGYADLSSLCTSIPGVATFGQYIEAAIASGLVSLVEGTATSRNALVSLRDAGPARGVGLRVPDNPPPPAQPTVSTTPMSSLPPRQVITITPPSVHVTPSSFRDLAMVLMGLQGSTGESVFRFSRVAPFLLKRKPDAYASVGVARFVDYVTLAMEHGVVKAGGMDQGDGWVSLSDPRPGGPAVTFQVSKLPGGGVDPKFADLVETLGEIWKNGEKKPLLSLVAAQLLESGDKVARSLDACGVNKFKAYAEFARDAGIIEIYYGRPWEERMSLNPAILVRAGYT